MEQRDRVETVVLHLVQAVDVAPRTDTPPTTEAIAAAATAQCLCQPSAQTLGDLRTATGGFAAVSLQANPTELRSDRSAPKSPSGIAGSLAQCTSICCPTARCRRGP
jgi:hypothetical protein